MVHNLISIKDVKPLDVIEYNFPYTKKVGRGVKHLHVKRYKGVMRIFPTYIRGVGMGRGFHIEFGNGRKGFVKEKSWVKVIVEPK